jgi:endopeptidase Clp ATP-binding regulatory subunit ClpX
MEKDKHLEDLQNHLEKLFQGKIPPFSGMPFTSGINRESEKEQPPPHAPSDAATLEKIRRFNLKPKEVRDHLDRFVIGQTQAKKVLSVATCDHFNHVRRCLEDPSFAAEEHHKQNILLLGPTGVGKTYLMRNLAKLIGVPFVKADATKFSETGYVGSDVEDLVRDLVKAANGNTELAQYGIIYIDEIDKIASSGNSGGKDVSGRGVQINLLKIMEDSEVSPFSPTDLMAQMRAMMGGATQPKGNIPTRHILFIVSGAFDQLAEAVSRRIHQSRIGFSATENQSSEWVSMALKQAETQDFIRYGFEPEFIGRLPVRVVCEPLSVKDLCQIMTTSEGSILRQYHRDFEGFGISFSMQPEAIIAVAEKAQMQQTGARGILTVLERALRDFKYELPSTGIRSFELNCAVLDNPEAELQNLLQRYEHLMDDVHRADLERFAKSFEEETELVLEFQDDALVEIAKQANASNQSIRSRCENLFRDARHGLRIIHRNSAQSRFVIDAAFVHDPDACLSQWVVQSFRSSNPPETKLNPAENSPPEHA